MPSNKFLCRKPFRGANDDPQGDAESVIAAEQFQLIDKEGRIRAVLELDNEQPGLFLYDQEEGLRAYLCLDEGGAPFLDMLDKGAIPRVMLGVNGGESNLDLYDKDGRGRAQIYVQADDAGPGLALFDRAGRPCVMLDVGEDQEGNLDFFDMEERRRASLTIVNDDDVKP
jgi:hypothetical protein